MNALELNHVVSVVTFIIRSNRNRFVEGFQYQITMTKCLQKNLQRCT